MSELTQDRLKELLHYDPETGVFMRLPRRGKGGNATLKPAGNIHWTGYVRICLALHGEPLARSRSEEGEMRVLRGVRYARGGRRRLRARGQAHFRGICED